MKKLLTSIIFSVCCLSLTYGQELKEGQKKWSSDNKLAVTDYKIKISDENTDPIFSQFVISHSISGFDFLKRNLNQKIENKFLGSASWIDTTRVETIEKQIEFQQIQFDLAEIEARKFRKRVLKEKNKIAKGFDFIDQINDELMTEYSEKRLELMRETESGRNEQKVAEWKIRIAKELKDLEEFRFDNENRIKLNE